MKRPISNKVFIHLTFALLWGLALVSGLIGIDFGTHWDERKMMKSVRDSVQTGMLLPGWYNYPSVSYDLVMLSTLPDAISSLLQENGNIPQAMSVLGEKVSHRDFTLQARTVFLIITLFSALWVYLLVYRLRSSLWEALLAAVILLSSWEVAYHARWIAPDGVLMQFGILTVLLVILSLRSTGYQKLVWLGLASSAAGLACGSKYYGGLFLIPVFLGGIDIGKGLKLNWHKSILFYTVVFSIFITAFLFSTPGGLVDPLHFLSDVRFEIHHYESGHFGYTVSPGLEHASRLFTYLAMVAFSKYWFIALVIFLFAVAGFYFTIRNQQDSLESLVLLAVPIIYFAFISSQEVMIVRNDLLLFPCLAILAARGITTLWTSPFFHKHFWGKTGLALVLFVALAANFSWLYTAAYTIKSRDKSNSGTKLAAYIQQNTNTNFYLSTQAKKLLPDSSLQSLHNVLSQTEGASVYLFMSSEVGDPLANQRNLYTVLFGPYEVNFNYYPSWDGDSRVVAISMKNALKQPIFGLTK
jgi:hypothetical protein